MPFINHAECANFVRQVLASAEETTTSLVSGEHWGGVDNNKNGTLCHHHAYDPNCPNATVPRPLWFAVAFGRFSPVVGQGARTPDADLRGFLVTETSRWHSRPHPRPRPALERAGSIVVMQ